MLGTSLPPIAAEAAKAILQGPSGSRVQPVRYFRNFQGGSLLISYCRFPCHQLELPEGDLEGASEVIRKALGLSGCSLGNPRSEHVHLAVSFQRLGKLTENDGEWMIGLIEGLGAKLTDDLPTAVTLEQFSLEMTDPPTRAC